jgi:hypothetical protein
MEDADQMTLAIEDPRAPAVRAVTGSAVDISDTEDDAHGCTEAARMRAAFWQRFGPRLEGRPFVLRRSTPDRFDPDLVIKRGAVIVWRQGEWKTRYRAGIFNTTPNPHVIRPADLSPLPNVGDHP